MKKFLSIVMVLAVTLLLSSPVLAETEDGGSQANHSQLMVTATNNTTDNQLLVYNNAGQLIQTVSTGGQGGVGGNSGGIEANGNMLAVVNFGSMNVSIFQRSGNSLSLSQTVATSASPVSVAFGHNHLYVLDTTKVESYSVNNNVVASTSDSSDPLLLADCSAAQVGVLNNQLIITEKNNVIETVNLAGDGTVTGSATLVQNIPSNVNAPFGLVTQGNNAYVTIAHADEISLIKNGMVVTTTPSVTQHAPCWVALVNKSDNTFLYSSNSPSKSISRYVVDGHKIVQDLAVAASLNGSPTDITSNHGTVAVIDSNGTDSHLSVFTTDASGNLTLSNTITTTLGVNGVAILSSQQQDE